MKKEHQWSLPVRYLVAGFSFILLLIGTWYIRSVLEPLIIAAFTAYLINPAIEYLARRTRLSRRVSVNLVYFIILAIVIGTPSTLTPIFFDEFTQVANDLLNLYDQSVTLLKEAPVLSGVPVDFGDIAVSLEEFRITFMDSLPEQALQLLESTSLGALWILVVMVAIYYILSSWPRTRNSLFNLVPGDYKPEIRELYRRIRQIWMSYWRSQILLMLIVGIVFTIAWMIIGIPGALVLGVVAGFLTLIPDVGPFIAALLAVGVALLEGSSWIPFANFWVALIALAVYLFLIAIKNFWLRPYILGRSVHISEALVFIMIILSTVLWGIMGALLVIPVVASLVIVFDYLRRRIFGMSPFPTTEEGKISVGVHLQKKPRPPHMRLRRKRK